MEAIIAKFDPGALNDSPFSSLNVEVKKIKDITECISEDENIRSEDNKECEKEINTLKEELASFKKTLKDPDDTTSEFHNEKTDFSSKVDNLSELVTSTKHILENIEKKTQASLKKQAMETTIRVVSEEKDDFLSKFDIKPVNATNIIEKLISQLVMERNQIDEEDKRKKLDTAIRVLPEYLYSVVSIGEIDTKDKDARYVLDQLTTTLRYLYLAAIQSNGEDSPNAVRIKEALTTAETYRSGMVYLRPASSYLRSSYTTTSLQDNPMVTWQNMLGHHSIRSIPLIGGSIYNYTVQGLGTDRAKIITEIDKQFWQNINRVRVSGAGNTNYVIAKDDIGNWYVKNYAADPEPIIRGAESLAAFSLGDTFNTDLLSRVQAARPGATKSANSTTPAQRPPGMVKVVNRFENEYVEATIEHLEGLIKNLEQKSDSNTNKEYSSVLTNTIVEELAPRVAGTENEKKEKAKGVIKNAAEGTIKDSVEQLKKAQVKETKAKRKISDIKESVKDNENKIIISLLNEILLDIDQPKRNARIMDDIDSKRVIKDDEDLNNKLKALRGDLGNPDPGKVIIEGLHSVRRFRNSLNVLLESLEFVGDDDDKKKKNKTEAQDNMTKTIRSFLDGFLDKRRRTINEYEERVVFISEITK